METGRKRRNLDVLNGGFKKSKSEMEYYGTGIGCKSKPCMKFFSTSGCQFGESCHFLHYVPGGYNAVTTQMSRDPYLPAISATPDIPTATVKTKLCKKFNTAEGCKFGYKCHFAHGELELGKGSISSNRSTRAEPVSNFGASATAKISVDASLAGAVIGKGGVISKEICKLTGVRLAIRDHESDPNKKNIELEGSFDRIKHASAMVEELVLKAGQGNSNSISNNSTNNRNNVGKWKTENLKTKLCEKFARGLCTYGERCQFAHGENELRQPTG
ncbi:zinc finger CCCH domain-containing protein 14-like [Impatiens glandulifera]|uniref:zinc finger CCCH domain-containing protein 14-like n=1 Tax=Impatiens glandulifera TaxID=253017 RepID=UPI001FB0F00E|nr:zinc finger CCCH domain-containing protein 14-like [Impatiens glandulifera]